MQLHRLEPHLHAISLGVLWHAAVGREQGKLPVSLIVLVQLSMTRHEAACWLSLIPPTYSTGRCTTFGIVAASARYGPTQAGLI
jgi:hypothetical protein